MPDWTQIEGPISVAADFIGLIGIIPILAILTRLISETFPSRQLLGFSQSRELDVIVTTSSFETSTVGAPVSRALTGVGQLKSVGIVSRTLGYFFPKLQVNVQLSELAEHRPSADVLLIGGPAKNAFSKLFLEVLCKHCTTPLKFDDLSQSVTVGAYSSSRVEMQNDGVRPAKETAIVVCWRNPFSRDSRTRGVLCCGLTTYGTIAAADWLFDDMLFQKPKRRVQYDGELRSLPHDFVAALEVQYAGPQVQRCTVMSLIPLTRS